MFAWTIPDYPWKLFQMIALESPGKLFVLPVGACSQNICSALAVETVFRCAM